MTKIGSMMTRKLELILTAGEIFTLNRLYIKNCLTYVCRQIVEDINEQTDQLSISFPLRLSIDSLIKFQEQLVVITGSTTRRSSSQLSGDSEYEDEDEKCVPIKITEKRIVDDVQKILQKIDTVLYLFTGDSQGNP